MSLFGLNRRLRGAAMGHLAAFEMTSSLPSRKMSQGLDRLGLGGAMTAYYDEHVEADAIHEQLAARDICGTLAEDEPDQAAEILFGAFTCLDLEARFATALLGVLGRRVTGRAPEDEFDHPDVVVVPHGPMLLRGAASVRDEAGKVHPRPPSGGGDLPLRQVRSAALLRRDAQAHPAALSSSGSRGVGRAAPARRARAGAPRPARAGPR